MNSALVALFLFFLCSSARATTYTVTDWNLSNLTNQISTNPLKPGDVVQFASGTTFYGTLDLGTLSGAAGNPITITSSDPSRPAVLVPYNGADAIRASGSYLTIENIAFKSFAPTTSYTDLAVSSENTLKVSSAAHPFSSSQAGQELAIWTGQDGWNTSHHTATFTISAVDSAGVATLQPENANAPTAATSPSATGGLGSVNSGGHGLYFSNGSSMSTDISIHDLTFNGLGSAIYFRGWPSGSATSGFANVTMWNLTCNGCGTGVSTFGTPQVSFPNMYIGWSTFTKGMYGINVEGVNAGLITNCLVKDNTGGDWSGIGAWQCNNLKIQYCIAATQHNIGTDSEGFDLDGGCTHSTIDHCLTYGNYSCGAYLCDSPSGNGASGRNQYNTIQYCISVNDGLDPKGNSSGLGISSYADGSWNDVVQNNLVVVTQHLVGDKGAVTQPVQGPTVNASTNAAFWIGSFAKPNELLSDHVSNNVAYLKAGVCNFLAVGPSPSVDLAQCFFDNNLFRADGVSPAFTITNDTWATTSYSTFASFYQALQPGITPASQRAFPAIADTDINGLLTETNTVDITTPGTVVYRLMAALAGGVGPVTTVSLSGTLGKNSWYTGSVTATLSAKAGAASVASTYYTLDGAAKQAYTRPIVISGDGVHTLNFWSVDAAGLIEGTNTQTVSIDTTAPSTTASATPAAGGYSVALTATDNASGVATTYYTVDGGTTNTYTGAVAVGGVDNHSISYWSTDVAGNTETSHTLTTKPSYQTFPDGLYKITNRWTNLLLDAGGNVVDQQSYSGSNQLWVLTSLGNNRVSIVSAANGLAITGRNQGAQLILQPYTGATSQQWFVCQSGQYSLVQNAASGEVMDDYGWVTSSGTMVDLFPSTMSANQDWTVSGAPPLAPINLRATSSDSNVQLSWRSRPELLTTTSIVGSMPARRIPGL